MIGYKTILDGLSVALKIFSHQMYVIKVFIYVYTK